MRSQGPRASTPRTRHTAVGTIPVHALRDEPADPHHGMTALTVVVVVCLVLSASLFDEESSRQWSGPPIVLDEAGPRPVAFDPDKPGLIILLGDADQYRRFRRRRAPAPPRTVDHDAPPAAAADPPPHARPAPPPTHTAPIPRTPPPANEGRAQPSASLRNPIIRRAAEGHAEQYDLLFPVGPGGRRVAEVLRPLLSPTGSIIHRADERTVLVRDTLDRLQDVIAILSVADDRFAGRRGVLGLSPRSAALLADARFRCSAPGDPADPRSLEVRGLIYALLACRPSPEAAECAPVAADRPPP